MVHREGINVRLTVFLVLIVIMTLTSVALSINIHVTSARDNAQQKCTAQTLVSAREWIRVQVARDKSLDERDEKAIPILDSMILGRQATPEEIMAWKDAILHDRQVRAQGANDLTNYPLPQC